MKIFPLRPMSTLDRARNILNIMAQNPSTSYRKLSTVNYTKPSESFQLKKIINAFKMRLDINRGTK